MDASKPMIPKVDAQTEYYQLEGLQKEMVAFLNKWDAYEVYADVAPTDAIIAIFRAQQQIVARRSYILGLLDRENIPF